MRTILLIEDNPSTRKLVCFTLGQKGYAVVEATDGRSAVRLLTEREPDLILQDLVLPDVDGFELATRLRGQLSGRNVPILAFSGFVTKLDEARISAVGFDDLIVKPIGPSRLIQIVQAHLPDVPGGADEHFGHGRTIVVADDDAFSRSLGREVEPRASESVPPLATKVGRILVIDDDLGVLSAVRRVLSQHHEVDAVSAAAEALAKLVAGERFDLILCDLMMPRMTGMDLYAWLQVLDAKQVERLVFMTGGAFSQKTRTFLGQVQNAVLEKPFGLSQLRRLVNERLR